MQRLAKVGGLAGQAKGGRGVQQAKHPEGQVRRQAQRVLRGMIHAQLQQVVHNVARQVQRVGQIAHDATGRVGHHAAIAL